MRKIEALDRLDIVNDILANGDRVMLSFDGEVAYLNRINGVRDKSFRYPTKEETGYRGGYILPQIKPSFSFRQGQKIFTLGSCFAREIESRLIVSGFNLPVTQFSLPPGEFVHAAPHLLNEYNAGTILQRIESAFGSFTYSDEMGIEETKDGYLDLFLHIHQKPVSLERLIQRRREISGLYQELLSSSVLVITLGLIEAWFDNEFGCFLNKAPSKAFIRKFPGRFVFQRMDYNDVHSRLRSVISLINSHGHKDILLTVSPVPIEATFSGSSAVIANVYSKSVLRVTAQSICEEFKNVDYFPSYEIATSAGTGGFANDNVHVTHETVNLIMSFMYDNYVEGHSRSEEAQKERQWGYIDVEAIRLAQDA